MILMRVAGLPCTALYPPASSNNAQFLPEPVNPAPFQAKIQDLFDQVLNTLPEGELRTKWYNARKAFYQKQRLPQLELIQTLPPALYRHFLEALYDYEQTLSWRERLEDLYTAALANEIRQIKSAAASDTFQRGLLFSSHDLLQQLPGFIQLDANTLNKKHRQTLLAVYQYLTRAVFKTSPFSRFTTVTLLRSDREDLEFEFNTAKVSVTPNVAVLPGIYEMLLREPHFYQTLALRLNPAFKKADEQHYTWLYFDGEQEAFQTAPISPLLTCVMRQLDDAGGVVPFSALLESLSAEINATTGQLEDFLRELTDVGMLEWVLPESGLSPSWTSSLATYLAHLPSSNLFTETAFLLQHLRVTARAIPFQTIEAAIATQRSAKNLLTDHFEKYTGKLLPIAPEQLFYEDIESPATTEVDRATIQTLTQTLASCWHEKKWHGLPDFKSRLTVYAQKHMTLEQVLDFQLFCADFLKFPESETTASAPAWKGKAGALLQVFNEGEQTRAVVNAMYPGGGKMFARWLHLFPAALKEQMEDWIDPQVVQFPWQGWSNANFQPQFGKTGLLTPDGRILQQGKKLLPLAELGVKLTAAGPVLWDRKSNTQLILNDLGLESPDTKPPVIRILYHLGVPYVSVSALVATDRPGKPVEGGQYWARLEYDSLVLARAKWVIDGRELRQQGGSPALQLAARKQQLKALGIPRFFFVQNAAERSKPQFVDMESPVSMLLFDRILRQKGDSPLLITEMLPTPDQWVTGAFPERHAAEFVVEFAV